MKTINYLLAPLLPLMLLWGCVREEPFRSRSGEGTLEAETVEEQQKTTRSVLVDSPAQSRAEVLWIAEDVIGVLGAGSGPNVRYNTDRTAIFSNGRKATIMAKAMTGISCLYMT